VLARALGGGEADQPFGAAQRVEQRLGAGAERVVLGRAQERRAPDRLRAAVQGVRLRRRREVAEVVDALHPDAPNRVSSSYLRAAARSAAGSCDRELIASFR
jgi:hypothetical protein